MDMVGPGRDLGGRCIDDLGRIMTLDDPLWSEV